MDSDLSFAVGGMSCASCIGRVEKEIARVPGIRYVSVNLTDGRGYAVSDGNPKWDDVAAAIQRAGYRPLERVPTDDEAALEFRAAGRRVLVAWAAALPIMVLMALHMGGIHLTWLPLAEALAGTAVLIGPGLRILRGAWRAAAHRHANMDTLVSLGTIAALSTAVLAIAELPIRSFGAVASMLPAFHLTGRLLETRLRRRTSEDLRSLTEAGPGAARIVGNPAAEELPVAAVKVGMRIRVLSGERIPLDGQVVSGEGSVSEAAISGEPLPVFKTAGDEVIGGTVLECGVLEFEVTRTGEDAFMARMIELVRRAQGVRIPLQELADRIAGIFAPAVLCFAIIMFGVWAVFHPEMTALLNRAARFLLWTPADAGQWTLAVYVMVSILVAACPCALALATPLAVGVGSGAAARRGLLIKGGEALQSSGELDVLIFDKTGTLTVGRPEVVFSNLSDEDAEAAAAVEAYSVHPLAKAIANWAGLKGLKVGDGPEPKEVDEVAGVGISAKVGGAEYRVGRPEAAFESESDAAGSVVMVFKNEKAVGHLVLRDPVKAEAAAAVAALRARGLRTVMATGDNHRNAEAVAAEVGIPLSDVRANLLPEDKLRIVQEFKQQQCRTGMVGDGINDAAALKAADVGFALGEGTDLSMEAGDVVITRGGLERISDALELSSLIVRKIRSNLIWAFAYNLIILPASAMALIHPLAAEAAMTLSSIGVVLNSVRMRRAKSLDSGA